MVCSKGTIYASIISSTLPLWGVYLYTTFGMASRSVWRFHWEETQNTEYKQLLLTYNKEDCLALYLLTNELTKIGSTADSQPNIDFADHPKQLSTFIGEQIHSRFEAILKFAHADYSAKKISLRQ